MRPPPPLLALPVLAIAASATAQVVPRDGQVFTASAVLVPGVYHLPNGVAIGASGVTLDLNGATLVGSGPESLKKVSLIGNDMALDSGVGTCGKEGQSVPVGVGQPTLRIDGLTVGGTA